MKQGRVPEYLDELQMQFTYFDWDVFISVLD